jgi:hypothetical protein
VEAGRGTNLDADHMLVIIKLWYRIIWVSKTMLQQVRRFGVERLNHGNVAKMYFHDPMESEPEPLSLDDKWKQMEEKCEKMNKENRVQQTTNIGKPDRKRGGFNRD